MQWFTPSLASRYLLPEANLFGFGKPLFEGVQRFWNALVCRRNSLRRPNGLEVHSRSCWTKKT